MKRNSIKGSDYKKYYKQLLLKKIGVIGQNKILNAKVLVVGAGGLGCPLMLYLAYSGVGNIGIVDNDRIELSNLSRQILFTKNDIGKHKTVIAKKIIKKINKKIIIKIFTKRMNNLNINEIAKNYSIICDGTDNFRTRYLINDYCIKNKKILISSAINQFDGQLFYFDFRKKTPCLRCFMPEIPTNNSCDAEGILSTTAGVLGTLQANEVIKTILNVEKDLAGNMLIFRGQENFLKKIKINVNPKCKNKC